MMTRKEGEKEEKKTQAQKKKKKEKMRWIGIHEMEEKKMLKTETHDNYEL